MHTLVLETGDRSEFQEKMYENPKPPKKLFFYMHVYVSNGQMSAYILDS